MSTRSKTFPAWPFLSLATILIVAVILLLLRQYRLTAFFDAIASTTGLGNPGKMPAPTPIRAIDELPVQQPNHQLTYEQSLAILEQEADVAALESQESLTILAGDSLSLWFPVDLLPPERTWLNQVRSGDTSAGLLRRLKLFDRTQPKTIFVMIGINDLIRGVTDETILENQRHIVRHLRRVHPDSQIVVQSILPYNREDPKWQGFFHLLAVSNSGIRQLNRQSKAMVAEEGVKYLDLHPLFTDAQGNLRAELSTDGLHLNTRGYLVWRSALQMYSQQELESRIGE